MGAGMGAGMRGGMGDAMRGGIVSDPWSRTTQFGAESPMPGKEAEYEAWMAQGGGMGGSVGPTSPPPPIDQERRNRSPGLKNNFYEISTADFKRPYGMRGGGGGGGGMDGGMGGGMGDMGGMGGMGGMGDMGGMGGMGGGMGGGMNNGMNSGM
eukprot:2298906-Prymnesium_polylepis.1